MWTSAFDRIAGSMTIVRFIFGFFRFAFLILLYFFILYYRFALPSVPLQVSSNKRKGDDDSSFVCLLTFSSTSFFLLFSFVFGDLSQSSWMIEPYCKQLQLKIEKQQIFDNTHPHKVKQWVKVFSKNCLAKLFCINWLH